MPGPKEVTIYDIARELNISAATVSRGLKNSPAVHKNTKRKILETAELLGYQSNTFASSLRSKRTHSIGVIVPRLNSYFMASVLAGMEDAASRAGYNLLIAQSLEEADKEKANAEMMFNKRVDGLLVSLAYNTTDLTHFAAFFRRRIPVVFFDRVHPADNATSVVIDNFSAAYAVTKHLIDQGCSRIMHLGGNLLRNVYRDRWEGYRKALADSGLSYSDQLHMISNLSEQSGLDAAARILSMTEADRPDAVFSANDTAAVHCMIALKAAGIKIPADIAFAGFNNDPISKIIEPNLTTVNYSGYDIGQTAAANLIDHLKGKTTILHTNMIILRAGIIIRPSSLKK